MLAQATAYPIGTLMIVAGLNSFRTSAQAAEFFGLPYEYPAASSSAANPWQYVFAARNVYIGITFLAMGYKCDARTIGVVELLGSLLGCFDMAPSLRNGPKSAWTRHASGTMILLSVGTALVFGGM